MIELQAWLVERSNHKIVNNTFIYEHIDLLPNVLILLLI